MRACSRLRSIGSRLRYAFHFYFFPFAPGCGTFPHFA